MGGSKGTPHGDHYGLRSNFALGRTPSQDKRQLRGEFSKLIRLLEEFTGLLVLKQKCQG